MPSVNGDWGKGEGRGGGKKERVGVGERERWGEGEREISAVLSGIGEQLSGKKIGLSIKNSADSISAAKYEYSADH